MLIFEKKKLRETQLCPVGDQFDIRFENRGSGQSVLHFEKIKKLRETQLWPVWPKSAQFWTNGNTIQSPVESEPGML